MRAGKYRTCTGIINSNPLIVCPIDDDETMTSLAQPTSIVWKFLNIKNKGILYLQPTTQRRIYRASGKKESLLIELLVGILLKIQLYLCDECTQYILVEWDSQWTRKICSSWKGGSRDRESLSHLAIVPLIKNICIINL